jgi:hypothetical protein
VVHALVGDGTAQRPVAAVGSRNQQHTTFHAGPGQQSDAQRRLGITGEQLLDRLAVVLLVVGARDRRQQQGGDQERRAHHSSTRRMSASNWAR